MNKILTIAALAALLTTGLAAQGTGTGTPPERPVIERPVLPDELKADIAAYRTEAVAIRQEIRAVIAALEDPTRETVKAAVNAYKAENAERMAAQEALRESIRDQLSAVVGERPDRPVRELPPEVQALKDEFIAMREEVSAARKALREALQAAATEEEKKALIEAFRADMQDELEALKAKRRELREAIGDLRGDRRPGGE